MAIRPSVQDVSIRQLQYAVAVADTLHFRKAAERCAVSQPTLSAQLRELESILGVTLFERDRRSVRITSAGEEIVARARRVLLETEDLVAAAERSRDPLTGTLRLAVIPTIAPYLLPELGPHLAAELPKLRIVFREQKTADAVRDLESGAIDAAVVALEADLGDVASATLVVDPFVVALPKRHPLAKKKKLELADLEGARVLLLDDGHCLRAQALALCARANADEADFRATSLATLAQMVSANEGITLLPKLAVPVENRRGQLVIRPFTAPAPSRTLALVWRPSSPLGAAFERVAEVLRAAATAASALAA